MTLIELKPEFDNEMEKALYEEPHCERCGKLTSDLDHDNLCEACQDDIYGKELP